MNVIRTRRIKLKLFEIGAFQRLRRSAKRNMIGGRRDVDKLNHFDLLPATLSGLHDRQGVELYENYIKD